MPPAHGKDTPYRIARDTPLGDSGTGRRLCQHPAQQRFGRYALPMFELFGLPEHTTNGTNRLSVVALGLMGSIGFCSEGLVD